LVSSFSSSATTPSSSCASAPKAPPWPWPVRPMSPKPPALREPPARKGLKPGYLAGRPAAWGFRTWRGAQALATRCAGPRLSWRKCILKYFAVFGRGYKCGPHPRVCKFSI
jgi:hypothetical protein